MDLTFISLINEEHIFMYSGPFVKNLFEFFCSFFLLFIFYRYTVSVGCSYIPDASPLSHSMNIFSFCLVTIFNGVF